MPRQDSGPKEYIRSLQSKFPPPKQISADALSWLKSLDLPANFDINSYQYDDSEDYAEKLFAIIKPGLLGFLDTISKQDRVAVGEIGSGTANVYWEQIGNDYAVVFCSGLRDFLYRVARPIAASMKIGSDLSTHTLPFPELARVIAEIFWWYQEAQIAWGPLYEIDFANIIVGSALATYAECFLFAHEFGHIYVSEMKKEKSQLDEELTDYDEEYAADSIGFQILITAGLAKSGPMPDIPIVYAGVEFALHVWRIMDRLGIQFVGPHPQATDRIINLRQQLQMACKSEEDYLYALRFAKDIEHILDMVSDIIIDPSEHEAAYDRAAQKIVEEMWDLVKKCVGEMWPDYSRFYSEAPKIFAKGFPTVLIDKVVVEICKRFKEYQNKIPQIKEFSKKKKTAEEEEKMHNEIMTWGAYFQMFKLFNGMHLFMEGPLAEIYKSAIEREMAK
jgi:hypothetical protein